MDDCLKSSKDEQVAIYTAQQLRLLLSQGGFRLTKWLSNSRTVIESVPEAERSKSLKEVPLSSLPTERALGVSWNTEADTFGFSISLKDKPPTRRGILSVVSSVYDPLGFAASFILRAKEILQGLCRANVGWDDPIPDIYAKRSEAWLRDLPKLEGLKIKRCFKPSGFGEVVSAELHHFSDASQVGYGAVSYLRMVNQKGKVHCAFVIGKSRLAPLKSFTIPRLELSAAVLATKLDKMIRKEIDTPIAESVFWTDSTCVLSYISNENNRLHTFVANRVSTIHDASSPSQWRHVDTKSNPADDASRGLEIEDLLDCRRWLEGPEFLWETKNCWPVLEREDISDVKEDDPEVKKCKSLAMKSIPVDASLNDIFAKFSSWHRLKRSVAWLFRYKSALRAARDRRLRGESALTQKRVRPLTVEEMQEAEYEIIKAVQRESFSNEITSIQKEESYASGNPTELRSINRSSSICKLDPTLKDSILCVGGRLRNSAISEHAKNPMILPKDNHVVKLIIEHYHEVSAHAGLEHVLMLLREKYWIVGARVAIKGVLTRCHGCKKRSAPVGEQKMADLPEDRVTVGKPTFTNVGVDCFGPFIVKRGRSQVKRYGVIFTCLAIRAVHIEVGNNLDTDSFVNALRRFVARRGQPDEIRSDNGRESCVSQSMRGTKIGSTSF